ncbi:MAG: glycosyltransferase family 9 protein [Alphaproteobacteria bacterium]|nr:glycosyltransferase family 9 protein [Alphaproteobacteria bacterium]
MRILFITSNRIGDAVLTTGVLAWLVKKYPKARFTIVCGPVAADLFRAVPRLKRLIVLRKKRWNGHWLGLWRECAGTRWDLIVDFRNSIVSRLLRAKKRAYPPASRTGGHKVKDNAAILNLDPPPAPHIWTDKAAEDAAAQLILHGAPVIALGPAANWPVKQWPIEKFVLLARRLTASHGPLPGARVFVTAAPHEREQIAPLLASLPSNRKIDALGLDLLTVAACLKRCRLFIGNDSGLMHIAAAVGTPTLGLFGPGYEKIYGPWGKHSAFVRTPESAEKLLARLPHPGAHHPNLMESLSVDVVYEAAKKLLSPAKVS